MSNAQRLMRTPLPINRTALRVVMPAFQEDIWQPEPKKITRPFSRNAIAIQEPPIDAPHIIGKRRDRLTVIGYAAEQSESKNTTRWVVRCDCGNYETRKRILRWLGTDAPDFCTECQVREFKKRGEWFPRSPAVRTTIAEHGFRGVQP